MNHMYCGLEGEPLNIGNGKTSSAVYDILCDIASHPEKKLYSNIVFAGIEYTKLTPQNLTTILEMENVIVLLDEVGAIMHNSHKISPACKKHEHEGLCYDIVQFSRQLRKRKIEAYYTAQSLYDTQAQLRKMMNRVVYCQKYGIVNGMLKKCTQDTCVPDHIHYIRQLDRMTMKESYIDISKVYQYYDSSEIVSGYWNLTSIKRQGRYFLLLKMVLRERKDLSLTILFCGKAGMTGYIAVDLNQ